MSNNVAYMREYVKDRYHRRRNEWIVKLGGKCVKCGATEQLEFDHKDRSQKTLSVGRAFASMSDARLSEELQKCQLLCRVCHEEKSIAEVGQTRTKDQHGTYSAYRHNACRCEACRAAASKYRRERRAHNSGLGQR